MRRRFRDGTPGTTRSEESEGLVITPNPARTSVMEPLACVLTVVSDVPGVSAVPALLSLPSSKGDLLFRNTNRPPPFGGTPLESSKEK